MPKNKNHQIIEKKKDYFTVSVGIFCIIFCILLIGRVGKAGEKLSLILSFILGDYSTCVLAFIIIYSVVFILFKKKIDLHHISFIGSIFIYIALSMYAHLGLYEPLSMTNGTILTKTLKLYQNYLINYEISYSCGGGIIAAVFVQISAYLLGTTGTILLGICFILVGLSFFSNMNLLNFLKGGKLKNIPKKLLNSVSNYIEHIHYPNLTQTKIKKKKVSISMLDDHEEGINFTLQNEINKEKFEDFKRYVKDNKIYCVVDSFYTSYSSSRFVLRMASKSDDDIKKISGFFNRNCFFIKKDNELFLEMPNQFRKLLTIKNLLMQESKYNYLPLALDVDGNSINLNMNRGRLIVVLGDYNSGVKSFVRSFLISIFMKNIKYEDIYFYDLLNEFSVINNTSIKYINNERSAAIGLDEAFNEYERRSEILKYLDADDIIEANQIIKKSHPELNQLMTEFHFLYLDLTKISSSLFQKIVYAVRFTLRVGIHIIICCRSSLELQKIELNNSDIIVFSTGDVNTSLKLFGSDMACRLQKKGDCLISSEGKIYHGQAPYISIQDFNDIIKKI